MYRHSSGRLALTVLASTLLLASCSVLNEIIMEPDQSTIRGSGVVREETREVSGFTGVELATVGTVHIVQGSREELRIEAEENLLPHLRTRVEGRLLRIETTNNVNLQPTRPVRYYLTVRDLDRATLSGSGSIQVEELRTRRLAATVSGSGGMELSGLNADALTLAVSGSGGASASGRVATQDVNLSGSGSFDGRNLESNRAGVNLSGSGSATLRVRERLDATVSGSGSVRYFGSPRVSQNVSGSGSVVRAGG
ncbi:MAG: DUF2807 domain-containing protein [Gemmatimonadetes bacterium]|nr:DUF2807 domain-containing protein [Gemmatimonadota bacterium]